MEIVRWWLVLQAVGLAGAPWAFRLLQALPDRGLLFAKTVGLIFVAYAFWLIGLTGLVRPDRTLAWALLGLALSVSFAELWRLRVPLGSHLRRTWPLLVTGEVLFAAALFFWAWVRSLWPDISHTEQPMDFALLNATLRAVAFPPSDPWLSGHSLPYYYFGYVMGGLLTHLSGLASSVSYNLALAGLAALAALAAYSLAANLVRVARDTRQAIVAGLLAALLLLGIGNLLGALELAYAHGAGSAGFWSWLGVKDLTQPYTSAVWYPTQNWWWWRSTRIIDTLVAGQSTDYTIQEFPFFSFYLGDLHPHVMDLPVVLLAVAIALQLWLRPRTVLEGDWRPRLGRLVAFGLLLGAVGFVNPWDLPTAWLLAVAALVLGAARDDLLRPWWRLAGTAAGLMGLALLLYLPYYLSFQSQVSGIVPVVALNSWPVHALLFWGGLAFGVASLVVWALLRQPLRQLPSPAWGPFALMLVWFLLAGWSHLVPAGFEQRLLSQLAWALGLAAVVVASAAAWSASRPEAHWRGYAFALLLAAVATLLVWGPEMFAVVDFFHNRMNTIFKLYYQAWVLLAVVAAVGLQTVASLKPRLPWQRALYGLWSLYAALLLAASVAYPLAVLAGQSAAAGTARSLDGLAWLKRQDPDEAAVVRWLEANASPESVIVEAVGGDYSDAARVSARTGIPAVLGWVGHEQQWRGSDEAFSGRAEDIASLYQSGDPSVIHGVIQRYGVAYVVVGRLERAQYGQAGLPALRSLLVPVVETGGVVLYAVSERTP